MVLAVNWRVLSGRDSYESFCLSLFLNPLHFKLPRTINFLVFIFTLSNARQFYFSCLGKSDKWQRVTCLFLFFSSFHFKLLKTINSFSILVCLMPEDFTCQRMQPLVAKTCLSLPDNFCSLYLCTSAAQNYPL